MIDIQRPRYVVYENVRGFVRFDLAARAANDDSRSTEGLASGLLKILYRCLVAMGCVFISRSLALGPLSRFPDTKSGQESCRLPTTGSHKLDVDSFCLLLSVESSSPGSHSHLMRAHSTNRICYCFPSASKATASQGAYDTSQTRCTFPYRRRLGTSRNGSGRSRTTTSPPMVRHNGCGTNSHQTRTSA